MTQEFSQHFTPDRKPPPITTTANTTMRIFHLLFTTKFSLFYPSTALDAKYDPGVQSTFYTRSEAASNNHDRQHDNENLPLALHDKILPFLPVNRFRRKI